MAKDFELVQIVVDEDQLKRASNRVRNQIVGCMHAHNELTVLNRLLMFTMNDTSEGEVHDSAQSMQMWFVLQILAGKLFETWLMICERFLKANPPDVVQRLSSNHQGSLQWLIKYFGLEKEMNDSPLRIIRDKTAFHYDQISLTEAVNNLAVGENRLYLAQHPVNTVYWIGSALVFRAAFAKIADRETNDVGASHADRVQKGAHVACCDVREANVHMHNVLYGLIKILLSELFGHPVEEAEQLRILVQDAPAPDQVGIPPFIDL